jgi:Phage P2 GpE./Phage tail protein E.
MSPKNTITLAQPIIRDGNEITTITITDEVKQAGTLRGLRLVNVMNMDVDSVSILLTRCTSPRLKLPEIAAMKTNDFVEICEVLTPFLVAAGCWHDERDGDGGRVNVPHFDLIDDLVADIAVIFNWPPSEVFAMSLGEVIAWRERAAIRSGNSEDERP